MLETIPSRKEALRQALRERARGIPDDARADLSKRACENVIEHSIYDFQKSVLLYVPLKNEIDVGFLLQAFARQGRRIALPRFIPEREAYGAFFVGDKPLQPGAFGVMEPDPELLVPLNRLDLVIVPGLGFDLWGRRIGRGKGFYDRMLSEVSGVKCGICFDEQVADEIPVEPHDACVDFLATPTRWLDCRGSTPETQ